MINYKKLRSQIHPLSSKKIPKYIQDRMRYTQNKRGYLFIPTPRQYPRDIYPLSSQTSKKKFIKLILEFFPDEYTFSIKQKKLLNQ